MGDSVQKIGGGPRMTVLAVNGDEITCVWNELGNERKETVDAKALTLYHEEGDFGVC
ncbi:DUF2158 domain-containing protein [Escherichia coli]